MSFFIFHFLFFIFFSCLINYSYSDNISDFCPNDNICSTKMTELNQWSLYSWKNKDIVQNVVYKDKKKYESVLQKLDVLPPLVNQNEVFN